MKKQVISVALFAVLGTMTVGCQAQYVSGTSRLTSGKYIDKNATTIQSWLEYDWYLSHLLEKDSSVSALPDTALFYSVYGVQYRDVKHVLDLNNTFKNRPMVGLSYEQCVAFCKWRTIMYQAPKESTVTFSLPSSDDLIKFMGENAQTELTEYCSDNPESTQGSFRCMANVHK